TALLGVESGLNDPMSIFLTIFVIRVIVVPAEATWQGAALLFVQEMAGGAALGLAGGWLLALLLRRMSLQIATAMVLVLIFGLAQVLHTSGFMAVYLAGIVIGACEHRAKREVEHFYEGFAWLAHIVLFLMLGLLVTPHELVPYIPTGIVVAIVLMLIARPV